MNQQFWVAIKNTIRDVTSAKKKGVLLTIFLPIFIPVANLPRYFQRFNHRALYDKLFTGTYARVSTQEHTPNVWITELSTHGRVDEAREKNENKITRLKCSRVSGARSSESFIARDTSGVSCPPLRPGGEFAKEIYDSRGQTRELGAAVQRGDAKII